MISRTLSVAVLAVLIFAVPAKAMEGEPGGGGRPARQSTAERLAIALGSALIGRGISHVTYANSEANEGISVAFGAGVGLAVTAPFIKAKNNKEWFQFIATSLALQAASYAVWRPASKTQRKIERYKDEKVQRELDELRAGTNANSSLAALQAQR